MVRLAIIGAGNMAEEHIKAIKSICGAELVGIQSRTKSRARELAKKYGIDHVAEDATALMLKSEPCGVVVAVNETETESVCKHLLKFKTPLLVEKPIGLDLYSAKRVLGQSEKLKTQVFVGLNRRHYDGVSHTSKYLNSSHAPRIVQIYDQEDPITAFENGRQKEVCENWHIANSIHLIDLFYVFCRGDVKSVEKTTFKRLGKRAFVIHALIKFDSGDCGIYHAIWNGPGPWSVVVQTEKKRFEMRPIENLNIQTYPSRTLSKQRFKSFQENLKPGFFCQMTEFIEALKGAQHKSTTLSAYIKSVNLANKIYEKIDLI